MKKIAIVCLVLGVFAACKAGERIGMTDDGGVFDVAVPATSGSAGMLADPAEPTLPSIYLSAPVPATSASSAPAVSK